MEAENLEKIQEQLKDVFRNAPARIKQQYLEALVEYIRFDGEKAEVKTKSNGSIAALQVGKDLNEENVTVVISQCKKKWQPAGDSNPCDGTENPGAKPEKTNENGGIGDEVTPEVTPDTPKTSQMDTLRAALAGLSRDELIGLLADALADTE